MHKFNLHSMPIYSRIPLFHSRLWYLRLKDKMQRLGGFKNTRVRLTSKVYPLKARPPNQRCLMTSWRNRFASKGIKNAIFPNHQNLNIWKGLQGIVFVCYTYFDPFGSSRLRLRSSLKKFSWPSHGIRVSSSLLDVLIREVVKKNR